VLFIFGLFNLQNQKGVKEFIFAMLYLLLTLQISDIEYAKSVTDVTNTKIFQIFLSFFLLREF